MRIVAFEDGGEQEATVSAFLMLVLEHGMEIGVLGVYGLLDRLLQVAMKWHRSVPRGTLPASEPCMRLSPHTAPRSVVLSALLAE